MEKSIETIWKEGFINSNELVAPKVNDLYNKKSIHIVDKFTHMFRINLLAIAIGSFFMLAMAYFVKIPYMGIGMFIMLNTLALINLRLMKGLTAINKNVNSFEYLKSFDEWMKNQISLNKKFATFFYPLVLLSVISGFWFGEIGGDIPGEQLIQGLLHRFPDMVLILGLPLYGLIAVSLFLIFIAYFAGRIYTWDLNLVYGSLLKKLDEILVDMTELSQ